MASLEPVDIDRDGTGDAYNEWDDDFKSNLEIRYNKLREFDETLNESTDEKTIEMTEKTKDAFKRGTIELIANQIYDRLTLLFNNIRKRFGIKGARIIEPIRNHDNYKLADDGALTYDGIEQPSEIRKLGVKKLRLMGFMTITDEDINPYKPRYKKAIEKIRRLDKNLEKRSKAIESSSATNAEAIEMIEVTSEDIDTTVKDVEQDTSFIEPNDRDKLLPLRELEGLDKQLRTIKGSLKVAIAKRVDLEAHIKQEERKLNKIQDPTYLADQRNIIEDRIRKLRGKLTERNKEIDILKGEASKQINQIKESITKF